MYEVYINYAGTTHKVTTEPVSMLGAHAIIEANHAETVEDLEFIMNKPSLAGLRSAVITRKIKGDDYDIVSATTGELVRRIHCYF